MSGYELNVFTVTKLTCPETKRAQYRVYSGGIPDEVFNSFLRFQERRGLSPSTSRSTAYDLARYFDYLDSHNYKWDKINVEHLVNYVHFLRYSPRNTNDPLILPTEHSQARGDKTIARMISSVLSFYRFHYYENGILFNFHESIINTQKPSIPSGVKHFLSYAEKARPESIRRAARPLVRYRKAKNKIKTIDNDTQVKLIESCNNNRDRLLMLLLLETGMRIGQVLGLRHRDIDSPNKQINIMPRVNNENGVYSKTRSGYSVQVSSEWISKYTDFLIYDLDDIESDYVFTKLYRKDNGPKYDPLTYPTVIFLFSEISKKLKIKITPHMTRHTFATKLLSQGVPMDMVSKQLGHSTVDVTRKIYEHLSPNDLREKLGIE